MNAVVNRHNQLAAGEKRRFMMRNMENVDVTTPEQRRNRPVIRPKTVSFGLIELLEVRRQRTKLMQMTARAEQEVFIARIKRSDIADEIPDVSPDPEFIDLPNIDRDSHSRSTQV